MACPKCGCKVHYQYNEADFGPDDERMERCAACGEIFDIEDSADEEDEHEEISAAAGVAFPGPAGGVNTPDGEQHGR